MHEKKEKYVNISCRYSKALCRCGWVEDKVVWEGVDCRWVHSWCLGGQELQMSVGLFASHPLQF